MLYYSSKCTSLQAAPQVALTFTSSRHKLNEIKGWLASTRNNMPDNTCTRGATSAQLTAVTLVTMQPKYAVQSTVKAVPERRNCKNTYAEVVKCCNELL